MVVEESTQQQQLQRNTSTTRSYIESEDNGELVIFPYYYHRRPASTPRMRPFLSSWRRISERDETAVTIAAGAPATVLSTTTRTAAASRSSVQQEDIEAALLLDTASNATLNNISNINSDIDVTYHHSHLSNQSYSYYTTESLMQLLRAVRGHDPNVQRIYLNGKQQQQQPQYHSSPHNKAGESQQQQYCRFFPVDYLTALLQALQGNPYVTHLTLSHAVSPKEDASTVVAALREYLQSCPDNLIHLDLSRNHFQAADIQQIFASSLTTTAIATTKLHLRKLNLEGNALGDVGVQAVCAALSLSKEATTLMQVSILKLGRNQMTAVGLQAVVNLLLSQQQQYKRKTNSNVTSSFHPINNDDDDDESSNGNNDSHIRRLDLRGNHLGSAAGLLANVLCRPDCLLESLSLRSNNLDNVTVTQLAQALETNFHLRTLDLQCNSAVDCGAALCRALRVNHTFTKLKLRHTAVNDVWKNELLETLLINTHGPELAQQTKSVMEQVIALQQKQSANKKWSGGEKNNTGTDSQLKHEQWDDTERTDMMSDEDEEEDDDRKWMDAWGIAMQSKTHAKQKQKQQMLLSECVICCGPMHESALLLPCTHHNCCKECGRRLRDCHMCRQVVVKIWPLQASEATDSNVDGLLLPPPKPAN